MDEQAELTELLSRLAGTIKDDDLEDPEITALMAQLMAILQPQEDSLPPELIEQLSQIEDKKQRFAMAAQALNAMDPNSLHELAQQMRASGLLKSEGAQLERAKKADLITLPEGIDGTNCSNCKYVSKKDGEEPHCEHEEVDQPVTSRMCCAYWDAEGVERAWENK